MRLSEAIRLGSLAIQDAESYRTDSCAIGMGLEAIGRRHIEVRFLDDTDDKNYEELAKAWPWVKLKYAGPAIPGLIPETDDDYTAAIFTIFDGAVMDGDMTLEALCDQVRTWENELASRGINVEQVTMAATPEATHEPAAENIPEPDVEPVATPRGGE